MMTEIKRLIDVVEIISEGSSGTSKQEGECSTSTSVASWVVALLSLNLSLSLTHTHTHIHTLLTKYL
jgi:hypothetical protein